MDSSIKSKSPKFWNYRCTPPYWLFLVSSETFTYLCFLCLSFLSHAVRETELQPRIDLLQPLWSAFLSLFLLFLSLFGLFSTLTAILFIFLLVMFLGTLLLMPQSYVVFPPFLSLFLTVSFTFFFIILIPLLNLTSLANTFPDVPLPPTPIIYCFWAFCSFW